MADVGFLLLVFFLATTAIRSDAGLPLVLPSTAETGSRTGDPLTLWARPDGSLSLGAEPLDRRGVRTAVADYARSADAPRVVVAAHRRAPYDAFIAALDATRLGSRDAGVPVQIAVREPAAD